MNETEKPEFEAIPEKTAPDIPDTVLKAKRDAIIEKLDDKALEKEVMKEKGIEPPPAKNKSIPTALPEMIFLILAKLVKCGKFALDEAEAKIMARQLSILIGEINNKIAAILIIIVIILYKIVVCIDAVKALFKRKPKEEKKNEEKKAEDIAKVGEVMG